MKNKLCSALSILCLIGIMIGCTKQTNDPEQHFEPTPLVIEDYDLEPQGVFYGTIVITGQGIEETGYEGLMLITMDGEYIRITCTDAVRSKWNERF